MSPLVFISLYPTIFFKDIFAMILPRYSFGVLFGEEDTRISQMKRYHQVRSDIHTLVISFTPLYVIYLRNIS